MNNFEISDPHFRAAIAAIDAGDVAEVERLVAEHPRLLSDRLDAGEGYFREPYLLWFVAGNPVRNETLPANIAEVARTIVRAAQDNAVESLPHQVGYTLGLVASGRVPRESGVQTALIDVLCEAGADPNGPLIAALAHRERDAAERLIERGAHVTLLAAVCLNRTADVDRLLDASSVEARQAALAGAALVGNVDALKALVDRRVEVDAYSPVWFHPHATALHHAVDSSNLDAVRVLVDAGARLDLRDRIYGGTPLDWANHLGRAEIAFYLGGLERNDGGAGVSPSEASPKIRSLVAMVHVADLPRSLAFYAKLGLEAQNTFTPDGGDAMTWAWLQHGAAQLMLVKASAPIDPQQQSVMFYVYFDDVPAAKAALEAAGIDAGPIAFPFYAPRGEFRVVDPDGYAVMVTHT